MNMNFLSDLTPLFWGAASFGLLFLIMMIFIENDQSVDEVEKLFNEFMAFFLIGALLVCTSFVFNNNAE